VLALGYDSRVVLKPPRLKPADRVAIVAPAGPFDRDSFEAGFETLARRYEPVFQPDLSDRLRYLAGADARRLRELRSALQDDRVRAVFCARGGYGSARLLRGLGDLQGLPPRALVGFSDITSLHLAWLAQGRSTLHGPVVTQLGRLATESVERLWECLESDDPPAPLTASRLVTRGVAEGPLVGGNLSTLTRLLGTPFFPDVTGALLLVEDVGERPYRLDRMWTHLDLAGVFQRVRGLVIGEFTNCAESNADYSAEQVVDELARATGLPCAAGFRIGHGEVNLAVPLGIRARLDADQRRLSFLEPFTDPGGRS
jgi:muramoyltetrapeptide carboxypeptidase